VHRDGLPGLAAVEVEVEEEEAEAMAEVDSSRNLELAALSAMS
jgi:hypothetical protein